MGEVYRARDDRLHRDLAIKVLPQSIAGDAGLLARFQSEARAASALNHPNIVTIHDIGSTDGVSYILMELVDGKTVRELLDGGPPPLKRTLQMAAQVAEGLAAAHARGIVHRDLKPENLMVSRDGVVKILDFGLAKSTPLFSRAGEETGSYEAVATTPGTVLGTVAYMSPEQASGRSLDFRSDQFSFGTILYEMITGKRAWKRNSAAETLTAIIREEPHPPIATVVPGTPVALRWVVDRCLAKEPDERYGSTRDLARDLTTLKDHLSEISGVAAQADGRRRPSPARRAVLIGGLGVAALGAGLLLAPLFRGNEKPPPRPNWSQVGFRRGVVWSGRFAPDGQTIVYSAAWDGDPVRLYSTRPGSTDTRTLDLPPGKLLSISSKSELAFVRDPSFLTLLYQPGTLVRAGLEGGVGRDLLESVQAADWSPDGTQLAVVRNVDGKVKLEYPLGKTLYEGRMPISDIRISRDGAWIAFFERIEGGAVVAVIRVSDGSRRVLTEGFFTAAGLAWSADGGEIWFTPQKQVRDSSPPLLAVSLAGKQREVVRAPGQLRLYDIAPDGRLLLARWDVQVGVRGFSPSVGHEREFSATDDSMLSDLSSDGRAVLFYDRNFLFLRATDGSPPLRLGEGYGGARLSPDGKWVLAVSSGPSRFPILVPVGAGEVRQIGTEVECEGVEWFPDGKRILCKIPNPNGPFRLLTIEVASGKVTELEIAQEAARSFEDGQYLAESATLSPDGAYLAGLGGGGDILILPLAGGQPRRIAASRTGLDSSARPVGWSADGRHLFIHRVGELPDKAQRLEIATGRLEPWRDLTLEDPAGLFRINPVRVAPDGRSWAYTYIRILSNLYVVDGLK
jgi:Tol biopolymer transport system component